jgi:glycerol-3-phosphate dehydrogenase
MPTTAIIGTGTWGTATAMVLARGDHDRVVLFGRDPAKVEDLRRTRRNPLLPGAELPPRLELSADPRALADADLVFWAVPTQHSAALAATVAPWLGPRARMVSLAKGLERGTLRRVSEILAAACGPRDYGCLSGPSHAEEVVRGLPVCLVVAGGTELRAAVSERMHGRRCRLYGSADLAGVELGGALKNVVAVAAGICEGLGLGDNTKAAMITRGLAEIRRLGRAMGAQDATFAGMAGIGDLMTTCYSAHGRNRALGLAIASGERPQQYLANQRMVAEGAWTCSAAVELARRHAVEVPIACEVESVIWRDKPVTAAIDDLLSRAPKEEDA